MTTSPQRSSRLFATSFREHVMLLCKGQQDCDSAAIELIDGALQAGQLCIYASVLNGDKRHVDAILSNIKNSKQSIDKGDLLVVDFFKYFDSALRFDLAPFMELKTQIESALDRRVREGKSDKTLIFAEAAGALSEGCHYDESANLETWWRDVHAEWVSRNLNITVICPHPAELLEEHRRHAKNRITLVHTLTLELEKLRRRQEASDTRILIVEPESDICEIYRRYLDRLGFEVVISTTGKEALEHALSPTDQGFDVIILDAHLKDSRAIEVARQIVSTIPDQRIVFTTTSSVAQIKADIRSIRLRSEEVLVKPFGFSSLLGLIRVQNQEKQRVPI